jgi:S-adenosylmethionine-diacylgycerolhomoserine-N-methlytransferase
MTLPTLSAEASATQTDRMDRMYGPQHAIYDLTRKYYLFGRDRMIARMPISPAHHVAEIGCGTGRNLVLLARKYPQTHFYGIDAATVMIRTASNKIARHSLADRIRLRQGMAEDVDSRGWFQIDAFDRVFFSYSLSMIPTWPQALEAALANLALGGELWSVDFWDQAEYPAVFASLLKRWLACFHVHFRKELLAYFQKLESQRRGTLTIESIGRRYAYMVRFVKTA